MSRLIKDKSVFKRLIDDLKLKEVPTIKDNLLVTEEIIALIWRHRKSKEGLSMSMDTIAELCHTQSYKTIERIFNQLRKLGLVQWTRRNKRTTIYFPSDLLTEYFNGHQDVQDVNGHDNSLNGHGTTPSMDTGVNLVPVPYKRVPDREENSTSHSSFYDDEVWLKEVETRLKAGFTREMAEQIATRKLNQTQTV